jgi:hypothetical protein
MIECKVARHAILLNLVTLREDYKAGRINRFKVSYEEAHRRMDIIYVPAIRKVEITSTIFT